MKNTPSSIIYSIPYLFDTFFTGKNVEFTVNASSDIKVLFTFFKNIEEDHKRIYDFLLRHNEYFFHHKDIFQMIFSLAKKYKLPIHISFDLRKRQTRIYLGMYFVDLTLAKKLVLEIKEKVSKGYIYAFEDDLCKVDCLGFNIGLEIGMKVYELIHDGDYLNLPEFVSESYVKEQGFLKDMKGRKKQFFRFSTPLDYKIFLGVFSKVFFDNLDIELGGRYSLQRQVKYYCLEGDKKEIYFI